MDTKRKEQLYQEDELLQNLLMKRQQFKEKLNYIDNILSDN